ncbi:MAG TPA: hypothetical protein PK005_06820 [Bacteroidales bacterium]|jgi:hypothetical protein|nr:hypothetical protein [Bacteroidales bacterium]MBP7036369.1 hypothetical protein [Bacteroidales bacterium]MBP8710246.1 hypothetical protein [Bacteroidales bacterium]HHV00248.1 hypothetical protein [Bacteroidales bacterium]HNV67118.1 hypothetical protein [Bacteroidales bacterium]
MSPVTTFISRRVEVPCGDRDLYAFMTDMNNLHAVLPSGSVTGWEATEERCSFETDRAGRITVTRAEALPHSEISYEAESFLTGRVKVRITIGFISAMRSAVRLDTGLEMNPLMRMLIGDSAGRYLDMLMDIIESYDGYDMIRGYNQSP